MKKLTLILFLIFTSFSQAQTTYQASMGKALGLWQENKIDEAIALFQRISKVDQNEWLPSYYQGLIYTTSALKASTNEEKIQWIEKAQLFFSTIPLEKKSAEWFVLEALCTTAELTIDPMKNAMTLSPVIQKTYKKALALEPRNPRALAGLIEFELQGKKFFNANTNQECEQLKKLPKLFDEQQSKVPFYPNWGKERVEEVIKTSCSN